MDFVCKWKIVHNFPPNFTQFYLKRSEYKPVNCSPAVVYVPSSMDYMPCWRIPNAPHNRTHIKFCSRTNKNDHPRKTCRNGKEKTKTIEIKWIVWLSTVRAHIFGEFPLGIMLQLWSRKIGSISHKILIFGCKSQRNVFILNWYSFPIKFIK